MSDDIEPVVVRVHARYEWDCPDCQETNDEADIEPATGETRECAGCKTVVTFE